MRYLRAALCAMGLVYSFAAPASAQTTWIGGSPLRASVRVGADGNTWVGVWLDAPATVVPQTRRAPMAVSLVIDTSGSMAGDKIYNARLAASSLLESLADGDIVSIYGFSNLTRQIVPPTVLSQATRQGLMQSIQTLSAVGGTNMYDGMQVATSQIANTPPSHPIRRIFLISDGHANVGPSDPATLASLAAQGTEWGTQVTAIGVGYDYSPTTLNAMVVASAGRMHHLGAPHQMADILEQELTTMGRSVALNGTIVVVPAPGARLISAATSGAVIRNNELRFPLGAITAGQRRELLFQMRAPTQSLGNYTLATIRLVYDKPDGSGEATQEAQVAYEVARRPEHRRTPRVAAMVASHEATVAQRRAAELIARGESDGAAAELESAERALNGVAAEFAGNAEVSGTMRRRATRMRSSASRARRAQAPAEQRELNFGLQAGSMADEGY